MLQILDFNAFGSDAHLLGVELNLLTEFHNGFLSVKVLEVFVSIPLPAVEAGAKTEVTWLRNQNRNLTIPLKTDAARLSLLRVSVYWMS